MPFYHSVGYDKNLPHIRNLYSVRSPELFEKELIELLDLFEPISIKELMRPNYSSQKPRMLLSFDDGFRGVKEYAHPILKKHKVPYVLFLNPAFIDNKELMYRNKASLLIEFSSEEKYHEKIVLELKENDAWLGSLELSLMNIDFSDKTLLDKIASKIGFSFDAFLNEEKPYLSTSEIKSLIADGCEVGSHTFNHPQLHLLPYSEQLKQIKKGADQIEDLFQVAKRYFSFPFTDDGISEQLMNELSDQCGIDVSFACAKLKTKSFQKHYQRIPMENMKEAGRALVQSEYFAFLIKKIIGKDQVSYS